MQKCQDALTMLPDDFSDLPVEQALEVLLINRAIDSATYFECKTRQEDEARWIRRQ